MLEDLHGRLSPHEYKVLRYLLYKVQNRHVIMALLIDVVLEQCDHNKTEAARRLGYSLRALRMKINSFGYETLQ